MFRWVVPCVRLWSARVVVHVVVGVTVHPLVGVGRSLVVSQVVLHVLAALLR